MNSHIPSQSMFFYREKWCEEMDMILLSSCLKLTRGGADGVDVVTDQMLDNIREVINHHFTTQLTSSELAGRLEHLKMRYKTFKELVAVTGVRWIRKNKLVEADDSVWKIILQMNPFAGAYYHRDEPHFNLVASMFGYDDVKIEESNNVITISDTTLLVETTDLIVITDSPVPDAPYKGIFVASPADPDEVNSPLLDHSTRVRRKLFDDEMIRMLTNCRPMWHLTVCASPVGLLGSNHQNHVSLLSNCTRHQKDRRLRHGAHTQHLARQPHEV